MQIPCYTITDLGNWCPIGEWCLVAEDDHSAVLGRFWGPSLLSTQLPILGDTEPTLEIAA